MAHKKRKIRPWSNFGHNIQVYDVCFEVDKLDFIGSTDGKDSPKYSAQHQKTMKLVSSYNAENCTGSLSLSKCRGIIQGPRMFEDTAFFSEGKKVAGNKGEGVLNG